MVCASSPPSACSMAGFISHAWAAHMPSAHVLETQSGHSRLHAQMRSAPRHLFRTRMRNHVRVQETGDIKSIDVSCIPGLRVEAPGVLSLASPSSPQ